MTDPSAAVPHGPPGLRPPWDDDPDEVYDNAPCGYLSTLPDGTIVKVNKTFLGWTGYRRAELVGHKRFQDLLSPGGRIYHETHYAPLLRLQNAVTEVALDVVCADGRRLPALVNAALGRDGDGAPRVIRTTVFNATERRSYERELMLARRSAEASESRVRVLQQVVAELAAAPTEAAVGEVVLRAPAAAFGAACSHLWRLDADRDRLVLVGSTDGRITGAEEVPLDSTRVVAAVARGGALRTIESLEQARNELPEMAESLLRRNRQAALLLPLTTGTPGAAGALDAPATVLGVLTCCFDESRALSDGELDVAQLLGHQAGQALERARLYDEARRREARAAFLAGTTRALDEIHRLLPRVERLVDRVVGEIAEWASVRLLVGAGVLAEAGGPAPDPDRLAERCAAVMVTGQAQLMDDGGPDPYLTVLPLTVRGRVLGTLSLRLPPGGRTPDAEAPFLNDLADRAALACENARLYEQERAIAHTLQRSLLAGELPADPRFAVETYYQAATEELQVGGDWYDAFLITADKLAVVVGDVVGRGIDAATTMGQLRSAIRALASAEAGPARLLERLDTFVERVESAHMATVAYGEITLSTGVLTYACAGHLPPLLQAPGEPPVLLWGGRSAPLGSMAGRTARLQDQVMLVPGSRLLLYTDGLIERRDRPLDEGFARLAADFAARRDTPLPGLGAGLALDLVGAEHPDDVCLLCVALGTGQRLDRAIVADPAQIARLRKDLRGWLAAHHIDEETRHAVLLACSEAVANAIEHGYRDDPGGVVEIAATVFADAVEIRVSDRGSWRPERLDAARGRGLDLIRQLMDQVSVERGAGTTITMRRARAEVSSD
ncbi:MAG TPA: SpoIIE family protein phosphatase [Actinoplanes sp.]|nr:SpoIIE family protein phosphatase [Actinoplanes sp.]